MHREDPRLHLTREWLRRVDGHIRGAEFLREDASLCEAVAFHSQQAVEKVLKAYLAWHNVPFRKPRDLTDLAEQCAKIDCDFRSLVPKVEPLTPYRTAGRYPFSRVAITTEKAGEALRVAHEVRGFVLDRLPPEARL